MPARSEPRGHAADGELLPFPAPAEEPLELLLPDAPAEGRRRAHRVARFLRLLSDDARGSRAPRSAASFERACAELERQTRAQVLGACDDLLRHHLRAHLGPESFAWHGEPERDVQTAWRALELARRELPALPRLPDPGEPALEVAARLVAGFAGLGLEPLELARRETWVLQAVEGPRAAEARYEALLDGAAGEVGPAREPALLAGLVECLLDRGAVREARLRLEARAGLLERDVRLRRLAVWTALAGGALEEARRVARDLAPWRGPLPAPLVELRRAWPEALGLLGGRELASPPSAPAEHGAGRREHGAALLAVLRFGPARSVQPLHLDVAPGLRAGLEAWLADREGACTVPTEPEHELVLHARPVRRHRFDAQPLNGALGRDGSLSLALTPILDEGEVVGWVAVECEHHLAPSPRRLDALAGAWREPLLRASTCAACGAGPRRSAPIEVRPAAREPSPLEEELPEPARALARETFEALVAALGIKTQTRAWWGIDASDGRPRLAASGGAGRAESGLSESSRQTGGARAVTRALATGGTVVFEEPDRRLSLDPDAASGVALPLVVRGRPCGALVIESSRRRDFRAGDVRRLAAAAGEFALALRAAQFRGWHLERYGHDVHLDTSLPGFRGWCEALFAAARSRAPLLLSGEKGAGKTVLARWAHFESGRAERELVVAGAGVDGATSGSLLLEEVGALSTERQEQLARVLDEDGGAGARLLASTSRSLDELAAEGAFRHDLAARLARLELFVPPLRDRREELTGLVSFFAGRFAAEERERPPRFDEEALALLWRQPWEGNLRQLEAFVFKLVLLRPGEDLGADEVKELARRFRLPLVPRVPSRHPRRRDLVAALRSTLLGSERINKRRAAARLGWDTGTLAARLADADLDEDALAREAHAWEAGEG